MSARQPRLAAPVRLPSFALDDQFGRVVDDATYRDVPLIVVAGAREGATGVAQWTAALRIAIGESSDLCVLPVADLAGVPRLFRRTVGRLLPRDPDHWCALDWDGQLCALLRRADSPLVAAAFDATGLRRLHRALPRDAVHASTLVALIEAARARK